MSITFEDVLVVQMGAPRVLVENLQCQQVNPSWVTYSIVREYRKSMDEVDKGRRDFHISIRRSDAQGEGSSLVGELSHSQS
jgi:hypothetical protein